MKTLKFEVLLCICLAAAATGCAQTPPESSATHPQPAPPEPSTVPAAAPLPAPDAATLVTPAPAVVQVTPALQDVLRMLRAGVEPSVLLTHIRQSAQPFEIGTDQILYLTDLGASGEVIHAMMERDQQLASAAAAPSAPSPTAIEVAPADARSAGATEEAVVGPPAETVTVEYFHDYLAPYGTWVELPGHGRCWQPTVVVTTPGWMPYGDGGRWLYTDYGWYWYSDYTWGWAAFHYGRWLHHSTYGWCWAPGTVWGPSWVTWRYTDQYAGWAPLPPTTYVSIGVSWSVPYYCYTYVPVHQVCHPRPRHWAVPHARSEHIHKQATVCNRYEVARDHTIVNRGLDPERVGRSDESLTRARVLNEGHTARPSRRGETFDAQQSVVRTFGPRSSPSRDSARTTALQRPARPESPTRQIPTATRLQPEEAGDNALVMRGSAPSRNVPSSSSASRERPELRERGSYFSATAPRSSVPPASSTSDQSSSATTARPTASPRADTPASTPVAASPTRTVPGSRSADSQPSDVPRVTGSGTTRVPMRSGIASPSDSSREDGRQRTMSATPGLPGRTTPFPEPSRATVTRSSPAQDSVRSPSLSEPSRTVPRVTAPSPSTVTRSSPGATSVRTPSTREPSQEVPRFTTPSRTVPSTAPSRSLPTRPSFAPTPRSVAPAPAPVRSFEPPPQRSREVPRMTAPAAPAPAPMRSFAAPVQPVREVPRVTAPTAPTRQIPTAAPPAPEPPSQPAPPSGRGVPRGRGGRE